MKLIVAGAKGFVATEVLRQSLSDARISFVLALARGPVTAPANLLPGADVSKLHSAIIEDYGTYSDELRKQFADADACIWTVAITPSKAKNFAPEEVRRVSNECALLGLKAMLEARKEAGKSTSLRFVYMSGTSAERDQSKTPWILAEYALMRGQGENQLLEYAAEQKRVEVCVAKPGIINGTDQYFKKYVFSTILGWAGIVPSVNVEEVAVAMLDQVLKGFEKEPLQNVDLVRIGKRVLQEKA